jgi:RNA polymerase-interacting CarD/CdnL/TRCF family regulator
MDLIRSEVRRVARRLNLQQLLESLCWWWTVSLFGALLGVLVAKVFDWPGAWVREGLGLLLGAGTMAGLVAAWWRRVSPARAALQIDQVFQLQERVTSVITLPRDLLQSPAGQALLQDTLRALQGRDLTGAFRLRAPKHAWLPLVPAGMALLAWFLLPAWRSRAEAEEPSSPEAWGAPDSTAFAKRLAQSVQPVAEVLKATETQKNGGAESKEWEEIRARLQKLVEELQQAKGFDPRAKSRELRDMERQLEAKHDALKKAEATRATLVRVAQRAQMALEAGHPLAEVQEALKRGDLAQAAEQLRKLAARLPQDQKLSAAEREALQKQLTQLAQEIAQLADIKAAIEKLARAGMDQEAIEKALRELQKQHGDMRELNQLCEGLANAAQALAHGQALEATEILEELATAVERLATDVDTLQALQETLDALAQMRQRLACQSCGGEGCAACGLGVAAAAEGQEGHGRGRRGPGVGGGGGTGHGPRPIAPDGTKTYDTRVPGRVQNSGKADYGLTPFGPVVPGAPQAEAELPEGPVAGLSPDAVERERLPRTYSEHAREYVDSLTND